jgi:hypothetical protein
LLEAKANLARTTARTLFQYVLLASVALAGGEALAEKNVLTQQEKQIAVGQVLGAVAFCGLASRLDQFRFAQQLAELQLTSADKPQIEKSRQDTYVKIRTAVTNADAHEAYCREAERNPLLKTVLRKFSEGDRNSDTSQQQEKIRTYGDIIGLMEFCGVSVDGQKLGNSLYAIGVMSESIPAVLARSKIKRTGLELERGQMKLNSNACSEVQSNAFVQQVKKTP